MNTLLTTNNGLMVAQTALSSVLYNKSITPFSEKNETK